MGRNVSHSFSLSWKKGFPVLSTFTWGQGHLSTVLWFFPAEKENFDCNQPFFFFFTALSEVLLSCRCRTGEWRACVTCSWPPTCSWRNQTQHFCVLLQGYAPCQTENVCNAIAFMDIPGHAIFPRFTWQIDSEGFIWKPDLIFYTKFRNYDVAQCGAEECKNTFSFTAFLFLLSSSITW